MSEQETVGLLSGHATDSRAALKRVVAFACGIMCCLCAASITIFSIYTPLFQSQLHLNQLQINSLSISAALAMYLPVPLVGYIGDRKYGQSKLAVTAALLFVSSYSVLASITGEQDGPINLKALTVCFALIGCATSCLYVSAVVTCARLYAGTPGLAISAPVTAFGLSSLWMSQAIPVWFKTPEGFSLVRTYRFFAGLYVVASILAIAAARIGKVEATVDEDDAGVDKTDTSDTRDHQSIIDNEASPQPDETPNPAAHHHDHLTPHERLVIFLGSHESWMLLLAFVVTSGPLEMYMNNMAAILGTSTDSDGATSGHVPPSPSNQLSIYFVFSTIARLTVGLFADYVRPHVSTAIILSSIVFMTGVCHFMLAFGLFTAHAGKLFFISSAMNGFSYGALFTLYPTMVACVWGVKSFGTNYGLFILGPAVGSFVYSVIYGYVYQSASEEDGLVCTGIECIRGTFMITGASIIFGSLVVLSLWQYSWKRNSLIRL